MRQVRFAVVLAGCLLNLFCLFFPLVTTHELFATGPMWLLGVLKSHREGRDSVSIEWLATAVEFGLINLFIGAVYVASYLCGRAFLVYTSVVAVFPILIAFAIHLCAWEYGMGYIDCYLIIGVPGYFFLAFVAGCWLVRRYRMDGFAKDLLPLSEWDKRPMRIIPSLARLSLVHKVLVGLWLLPASCLFITGVQIREEAARIAAAPRLRAEDLMLAYEREPMITRKRYDHRFIVLTGIGNISNAGLFGDGTIDMSGIQCDVNGRYGPCRGGEACTIAGTCEGKDDYGRITLSNCRALP